MRTKFSTISRIIIIISIFMMCQSSITLAGETHPTKDERMEWWREARFGLFIHWGLYAIPAGEWNGETNHAEWIRTTAQIPLEEYNKFISQFNPVKFNADEWVTLAKAAGMKYIVITSKHHDGFCLFDSKYTDFDVMSTPFKRDIMHELAEACRKQGMKICWYHSIMDWHHPDYLPRRDWEKDRPSDNADFDRYVAYMKNQLEELLTQYGDIGVLWFDGEWESTWNRAYGQDLYKYVSGLQPNIIINNRVGAGRSGMEGFTKGDEFAGDFGTPEQQIPATGLPGVDWETCMTMNNHWGYNKHDNNWKSTEDLLQKLADIASKGGNFLLNVGPTSEGLIPQPSIERLQAMGKWMKINCESIYGTSASPFKQLEWGRCTQKPIEGGTRLYLHVFNWPQNEHLVVPGIYNQAKQAYLLTDPKSALKVDRQEDAMIITVPKTAPDAINSVVVLDIAGKPDISNPPEIRSDFDIFIDDIEVTIHSDRENVEIHYTTDASVPSLKSPVAKDKIKLTQTTMLSARCFRDGKPVSATIKQTFSKVKPRAAMKITNLIPGLNYSYFEGDWDNLPDFTQLEPVKKGIIENFNFSPRKQVEYFGFTYEGYIEIPQSGVYAFYTDSDDGSRLFIGDERIVDNDGLHGLQERQGVIPLEKGYHPIRVIFFEKTGGDDLIVSMKGPGLEKQPIPAEMLFCKEK